uniref:HAUS augmin-like complex subunit 3 N-terminal domain-containing protein n=1 Tax=Phlebotomus papatasi TaxID=29031 RepID=A0A1B0DNA0_PHLPP
MNKAAKRELLDGKYLEYDPEWANLFAWLRENITIDNFVSKSMEENAKCEEFSEEELAKIEEDFPGIFEVRDSDLKAAEAQLGALKKAEVEFREQNAQLGKILEQVNDEVRELSKKTADTEARCEIWRQKVEAHEEKLDFLSKERAKKVEKLKEIYKNPEEILAVGHIPMDALNMNMLAAENLLDNCMSTFNTGGSGSDSENLSGKIEFFAEENLRLYEKLLEIKEELGGVEAASEMFNKFTDFPMTSEEIERQIAEMENRSEICVMQIEGLTTQCMMAKKLEITKEKQEVYRKIQEERLQKSENRLQRLQEISKVTGQINLIADIIWVLLQMDRKRIKDVISVLGMTDQVDLEDLLWDFDFNSSSLEPDILAPFREPTVKFVLNPNRNDLMQEKFCQFRRIEQALKDMVFGPTKTPTLYSPEISIRMHFLKILGTQNEAQLKEIKDRYTKEYLEPNKNKIWGYRRRLWIWFLTKPEKIHMAIDYVTREAANTPRRTKTLPGIRNVQ